MLKTAIGLEKKNLHQRFWQQSKTPFRLTQGPLVNCNVLLEIIGYKTGLGQHIRTRCNLKLQYIKNDISE